MSEDRTERLSVLVTKEERDRLDKFVEQNDWTIAALLRRGIDTMTDPSVATIRFDQPIAEALTVIAQEKEWDLNTLVRAAVKVQYPDVFKK